MSDQLGWNILPPVCLLLGCTTEEILGPLAVEVKQQPFVAHTGGYLSAGSLRWQEAAAEPTLAFLTPGQGCVFSSVVKDCGFCRTH